jgi:hypothetical protein
MQYLRSVTVTLAVALAGLFAAPAFAIGTPASTPVVNNVSLTYSVSGFAQAPKSSSVTFVVDRAIATLVATQNASAVQVTPGQTSGGAGAYPALVFDVTNTGNDTQDLWLALIEQGATAVTGLGGQGTGAAFAATAPVVAIDTNSSGSYDGTDVVIPLTGNHYVLSDMTPDQTRRVLVAVNVPVAALDSDRDAFTLVAGVAIAGGGAFITGDSNGNNAPGSAGATSAADDTAVVQNVFADGAAAAVEDIVYNFTGGVAGVADVASNGQRSDTSAFVVNAAELFVGKVVEVLYDPINGNRYSTNNSNTQSGSNPKAIPGAVLMYTVGVSNETGSPDATGVSITDDLSTTEVSVGNFNAVAGINVPDTVSVTLNAVPTAMDVPDSPNLDLINYRTCAAPATPATTAFAGSDPEVTVSIGVCTATQKGVIVYFVTLK